MRRRDDGDDDSLPVMVPRSDNGLAAIPPERVRRLPQVRVTDRIDVALAVLRRAGAHLGRAVDDTRAKAGRRR